ncbi:MAG: YlxR family protein [Ruminococcaceae bacterium]|nr:YlxR family protein [Oscillospiraceae bacterium]
MPQVQKKIPERRCVGCGNPFPKKDLVRVVKTPDGSIELDFTGKKAGRGAYVCRNIDCLIKARKAKRLERSLNTSIPEEVSEALEAELKQYAETD